ncbi:putative sodium/solute symporter [Danaus plexippus plexippus]|uniref:Sodium/solute symporter n=1 Tax=Danaus plexippus plexippus TaxID=278856 RepID=A0A212F722_DANPL|nr:putative sodium/solute symporter [Danaus plexippus plexippus]
MMNNVLREIVMSASGESKEYKENHNICAKHGIIQLNTKRSKLISSDLPNDEDMASNSGLNGLYRPRSALARALYEKQRNDRHLQEFDQHEWYRVDKSLLSEDLQKKFIQLHPDEETKQFLSSSIDKSSWVWTQIWYMLAKAVLKHFWTITDINGDTVDSKECRVKLFSEKRSATGASPLIRKGYKNCDRIKSGPLKIVYEGNANKCNITRETKQPERIL